jgi:hypothetical protein
LITGLATWVLREEVATYAVEEFKRQLQVRLESARSHLAALRNRREKFKVEIANLAGAVAQGYSSTTLLAELGKRERELDDIIEGRLHGAEPMRRLSKRNRFAISHVSRYYLEMLRSIGTNGRTKAIGSSTEFGLKRPRAFLAIRMDAYFMIRSTPSTRIGSFYLV